MTCGLIDIGANLLHGQFDADRTEVLTRACAAGVERIVITATELAAIPAIVGFIERHGQRPDWPQLYATAGIHPHDAAGAPPAFEAALLEWFQHPAIVSAGEAGLDYHRGFSPREVQRQVFAAQIAVARDTRMPLFVHDRNAAGETLELLHAGGIAPEQVVIHCFTGTGEALDAYLDAGFHIGITGWVCDRRRGESLRTLVPRIPLTRLLIETDAPYLLPHGLPKALRPADGRRNEPALLPQIATTLATLMDVDVATLSRVTRENAIRFFRLPE